MNEIKAAEKPSKVHEQVTRCSEEAAQLQKLITRLGERLTPVVGITDSEGIPNLETDELCPLAIDLADIGDRINGGNRQLEHLLSILQL